MNNICIQYFKTSAGELILGSYDGKLCMADWKYRKMRNSIDKRIQKYFKSEFIEENSDVLEQVRIQLNEYFNFERKVFTVPLVFAGTEFQKSVWQALISVEYGKTLSYLELAKNIGNERAVRAVANAISILVPCHRIIGKNGNLVGYAGGLSAKKKLLEIENNLFSGVIS